MNFSLLNLFLALISFLFWMAARAENAPIAQRITMKAGTLVILQGITQLPMTNEVALPHDIRVMTNGTFCVKNGKPRPLEDGQILGADGMLTSRDGTVRPVIDHITLLRGRPVVMKDGEESILPDNLDLPDGQRITADGYLLSKSGVSRKLLDGEIIELGGKTIPAQDTITLKDGKVIVQKDGSSLEVPPGRSIMMNDGTKVFGDGSVVMNDGTKTNLSPDQILKLEGVTPNGK